MVFSYGFREVYLEVVQGDLVQYIGHIPRMEARPAMKKLKLVLAAALIFFAGCFAGGALVFHATPSPVQQQVSRLVLLWQALIAPAPQRLASSEQVRNNLVNSLGVEMSGSAAVFAWANESDRRFIAKIARWAIDEDIYGDGRARMDPVDLLVAHCIADNAASPEAVHSCMQKLSAQMAVVWRAPTSG